MGSTSPTFLFEYLKGTAIYMPSSLEAGQHTDMLS